MARKSRQTQETIDFEQDQNEVQLLRSQYDSKQLLE